MYSYLESIGMKPFLFSPNFDLSIAALKRLNHGRKKREYFWRIQAPGI